jgi:hypothetical protein
MTMKDCSNRSYTDHTESTNCSYSFRVDAELEELAATFQSELLESGLVKDHKTSFARKVANAFTGKEVALVDAAHGVAGRRTGEREGDNGGVPVDAARDGEGQAAGGQRE